MRDHKVYVRSGETGWLRDLLLLGIVLAIPFLQYLGELPLIDPDEGRYAEIPREMLERGDLITPTLNYVKYFEKPPLLYWLNAGSLKLFGLSEFAARLPGALSGLLTVLATYIIARRLYDRRTALLSSLILGTSAGFILQSRIILTDMLLTFCLTVALGAFIVATQRGERRSSSFPWYLFYLFCALAVLTKGLIGIVFPAGIAFFYLMLTNGWRRIPRMRLGTGLLLFMAVAAPWFVAVSMKNPEFPRFFFIHEHFERFISTTHARYQPFWFFIPILAGTMLPWSFFIPGALTRAWRDRHHEDGQPSLYLFVWVALIFLFFSKSNSKLIPYILPIFPPLAILISHRITNALDGTGREFKTAALSLGAVLTLLGVAFLGYSRLPQLAAMLSEFLPHYAKQLNKFASHAPSISTLGCITLGVLFLLQGLVTMRAAGRNPMQMLVALCLASFIIEILVPWQIISGIAQTESPRRLALTARSLAGPDSRIVTFGPMQAVSWYTGRRVLVTASRDELEFGSHQGNQAAWFPDQQALLELWGSGTPLLVFLKKKEFENISAKLSPPAAIKGDSGRLLLISNR